jgi:hypothetical protein
VDIDHQVSCYYTPADSSYLDDQGLMESFIRIVFKLGSFYDSFSRNEKTDVSKGCAEVQLRFLISSDVYEEAGLIGIFFTQSY